TLRPIFGRSPRVRRSNTFSALVCLFSVFLFFSCSGDPRDLHSFPTRRSSDLEKFEEFLAVARLAGKDGAYAFEPAADAPMGGVIAVTTRRVVVCHVTSDFLVRVRIA